MNVKKMMIQGATFFEFQFCSLEKAKKLRSLSAPLGHTINLAYTVVTVSTKLKPYYRRVISLLLSEEALQF